MGYPLKFLEADDEQWLRMLDVNLLGTVRMCRAALPKLRESRYEARGYSATRFQLRMSREEIGNYLGLTIESISRLLSKFKKEGLLHVRNREIEVIDSVRLKSITAGTSECR